MQNQVRKKKKQTIASRCVAAARDRTFQGLCGAPGNKGPFLSPWKGLVERVWQFQGRKSQGRYFARKKMVRRRSVRTRRQKSVDFVVLFSEDVVQFSKTPVRPLAKHRAKSAGSWAPGPALQGAHGDATWGRSAHNCPLPCQLHSHHHWQSPGSSNFPPTQALQMFRKSSFRVRIHLQPLGSPAQLQPLARSLGLKGDNSGDVPQNKGRARQERFRPPRAHPLLKILPWPLQSQRLSTQVLWHCPSS